MRTAIAILLFLPAAADAATIEVVTLPGKQLYRSVITVTGRINDGDHRTFREKVESAAWPVIVAFNSPGGHLISGLDIGEQIKAKSFATLVPSTMTCASACALAWLAGWPRYIAPQGRVGFHAVFNEKDHEVSSVGNAVTGAYLNKLGMSYYAIVLITTPAPSTIQWLTKDRAMNVGIIFNPDDPTVIKDAPLGFAPREAAKTIAPGAEPVPNSGSKHDKLAVQLPPEGPREVPEAAAVRHDGSMAPQRDVPGGPLPTIPVAPWPVAAKPVLGVNKAVP
jgi:hypothetical protein